MHMYLCVLGGDDKRAAVHLHNAGVGDVPRNVRGPSRPIAVFKVKHQRRSVRV